MHIRTIRRSYIAKDTNYREFRWLHWLWHRCIHFTALRLGFGFLPAHTEEIDTKIRVRVHRQTSAHVSIGALDLKSFFFFLFPSAFLSRRYSILLRKRKLWRSTVPGMLQLAELSFPDNDYIAST